MSSGCEGLGGDTVRTLCRFDLNLSQTNALAPQRTEKPMIIKCDARDVTFCGEGSTASVSALVSRRF